MCICLYLPILVTILYSRKTNEHWLVNLAVASETGAGGARAPPLFREEGQSPLTLELF